MVLAILVLTGGCLWYGGGGGPAATSSTETTVTKSLTESTTVATVSSSTTMTLQEVNKTKVCLEARIRQRMYDKCQRYPPGSLSLKPEERDLCAEITHNNQEYLRSIVVDLRGCQNIKPENLPETDKNAPLTCLDLESIEDRDNCYMTFRVCDKITDYTLKQQCKASLTID